MIESLERELAGKIDPSVISSVQFVNINNTRIKRSRKNKGNGTERITTTD